MTLRTYLADRRAGPRFQINGQLWASIDVHDDVVLRNLGANGALIEASLGPRVRSIRDAQINLPEGGPQLTVLIRHVSPVTASPAHDRHLLGVEFIKASGADRQAIDACVETWNERHRSA